MCSRSGAFLIASTLALFADRNLRGQTNASTPPPRTLYAVDRVKLQIPMFGGVGNARCDAAGDLYFDVSPGAFDRGPFLMVGSDGESHRIFQLPEAVTKSGNITWGVAPDGALYVLHDDLTKHTLLIFGGDGSISGRGILEIPESVDVRQLAVTNSRFVFVSGSLRTDDPIEKKRRGFAALLNPSGKVIRDLSANAPEFDFLAAQRHPPDGDVIAGEDGRFYFLTGRDVRVLTQSGEVQSVYPFKKPEEDSYATRIDYSKGRISIVLHTLVNSGPNRAPRMVARALVMNAQTGEIDGDYKFADSTTGSVVCYDAREGYTLLAVDGKMAAKDIVPVR